MDALIAWFAETATNIWNAIVQFFTDLGVIILDGFLGAIASLIETIPVPAFIDGGMSAYLLAIDPGLLYFIGRSGLPQAFALLGAGLTFRLTRKIVTLGRW